MFNRVVSLCVVSALSFCSRPVLARDWEVKVCLGSVGKDIGSVAVAGEEILTKIKENTKFTFLTHGNKILTEEEATIMPDVQNISSVSSNPKKALEGHISNTLTTLGFLLWLILVGGSLFVFLDFVIMPNMPWVENAKEMPTINIFHNRPQNLSFMPAFVWISLGGFLLLTIVIPFVSWSCQCQGVADVNLRSVLWAAAGHILKAGIWIVLCALLDRAEYMTTEKTWGGISSVLAFPKAPVAASIGAAMVCTWNFHLVLTVERLPPRPKSKTYPSRIKKRNLIRGIESVSQSGCMMGFHQKTEKFSNRRSGSSREILGGCTLS